MSTLRQMKRAITEPITVEMLMMKTPCSDNAVSTHDTTITSSL